MRKTLVLTLLLSALCARSDEAARLVTVRPDGTVMPTGVVATVTALAEASAQAQAAIAGATAASAAATLVSNAVAEIEALENARNGTGYIRLFAESFTPGIEASTNIAASIVLFSAASNNAQYAWWDIWTYFSEDPGSWPYVRTADSAGRTNAWDLIDSESVELGEILVGSTLYEAYRNTVKMDVATTGAFFRVHADVTGTGTNAIYFPVNNGIAVNGVDPFTGTLTDGTNTMRWIGGVRVQ